MYDRAQAERAQKRYRSNAASYDGDMSGVGNMRIAAVDKLDLRPGDTVLDFGCGTGLSFELMQQKVGPEGRIIGVDLSADMLEKARSRIEARCWQNVTLVESNANTVDIQEQVDGVLCFFTHDIMNSEPAVERALAPLKPGKRLVAAGVKRARGLSGIRKNIETYNFSKRFITTKVFATLFFGTAVPWSSTREADGPIEVAVRAERYGLHRLCRQALVIPRYRKRTVTIPRWWYWVLLEVVGYVAICFLTSVP